MKRGLLVFFLMAAVFPLHSSYFVSNELWQKKSAADGPSSSEWVLYTAPQTEILYHDAVEYGRRDTTGETETRRTGGREEIIIRSSDGNIERRIISENGSTEEYNYFYRDGILAGYNYSQNGTVTENVEYTSTSDGLLLLYRVREGGVYLTDSFFIREGEEKTSYAQLGEEDERERTEDGGYRKTDGERSEEYDSSGRLVAETGPSYAARYSYSPDGELLEKRETTENGSIVTLYHPAQVVIRYGADGSVISERRSLDDGTVEEKRFVDGKAKYVFIYDRDSSRIKEAYAL